jgi:hypothetical protein
MDRKEAEALHSAMEDEGCEDLTLRSDYSGRGQYGKDTWAISGDFSWCVVAVAWAQVCVGDDEYQPDDLKFTWDALGLGTVIY